MSKTRLDLLLVSRGLAPSRAKAQALIMAGQVRVEGQVVIKASTKVAPSAQIAVDGGPKYVSRGGRKLEAALAAFPVQVSGRVCADVGASTGGFTDCLLQNGAEKVYAIDVGRGILAWRLRNDPRVIVMEGVNARYVDALPEPVSLITVDASFISLKVLLPVVRRWFAAPAEMPGESILLIKPQFEAGRREAARGKGVIRSPAVHRRVLEEILTFAQQNRFSVCGLTRSPVLGPKGNVEFLAWLRVDAPPASPSVLAEWIDSSVPADVPPAQPPATAKNL